MILAWCFQTPLTSEGETMYVPCDVSVLGAVRSTVLSRLAVETITLGRIAFGANPQIANSSRSVVVTSAHSRKVCAPYFSSKLKHSFLMPRHFVQHQPISAAEGEVNDLWSHRNAFVGSGCRMVATDPDDCYPEACMFSLAALLKQEVHPFAQSVVRGEVPLSEDPMHLSVMT
jgi:hypothetical protein